MGMARKSNKLNLLKGFACLGVVLIHIPFPGRFGQIVLYAAQYAVPVFFMIAGYFAFGRGADVIRRRLKKIAGIFLAAYLLFFLVKITPSIRAHTVGIWLAENFSRSTPVKYLCFCTISFAIALWYLIAMLEIYVLWLFVVKRGMERAVLRLTPLLFVLHILLTCFCETKGLPWFWKINFLTSGLSWFLLGYWMNTPQAAGLRAAGAGRLWLLAGLGCAITVLPAALGLSLKLNALGYLPYTLGLFALALKQPDRSVCRAMEFIGEKLSLFVYLLHIPVYDALHAVFRGLGLDTDSALFLWCEPLLVLIATLLVSLLLASLAGRHRHPARSARGQNSTES